MRCMFRWMLCLALLLTFFAVGLGAYVRLNDAGLGCPDWPGCYGHFWMPTTAQEVAEAAKNYPDSFFFAERASKEMLHRYVTSLLGLVIIALVWLSFKTKTLPQSVCYRTLGLLGIVIAQGIMGLLTVTMALRPIIVSIHLGGGMLTLVWLVSLFFSTDPAVVARVQRWKPDRALLSWTYGLLFVLSIQVLLGAWVSSNYAALACSGFPQCNGSWWPESVVWSQVLDPLRDLEGSDSAIDLIGIHWLHRLGVVAVLVTSLLWFYRAYRAGHCILGGLFLILLGCQVGLGVANVQLGLPLNLAVGHNLVAACMLSYLVAVMTLLRGISQQRGSR